MNMSGRALTAVLAFLASGLAVSADPVRFSTIDYAPYALSDDLKGRKGLIVDVVNATSQRAALEHSNAVLPISRVLKDLASGLADCGVFLQTGPSLKAYEQVAKIYERFDTVIVARQGIPLQSAADLKGYRLAIPRHSFEGSSILEDPEIEIVLTNSIAQSVALIHAGRVDAVAGTDLSIRYEFSLLEGGAEGVGDILTYERQEMWLQCAKGQLPQQSLTALREAADALRDGGVYDDIMRSYTHSQPVSQ